MFAMMTNYSTREDQFIYQFSLAKNFDVSTATLVGKYQMTDFLQLSGTHWICFCT